MSTVASRATLCAMSTIASQVAEPVSVVVRQPSAIRKAPSPTSDTVRADQSSLKSRLRNACARARPRRSECASTGRGYPRRRVASPRAVLLDVDFTLVRPGPELGPEAYEALGAEHGLKLDTERYAEARAPSRTSSASRARPRRGGRCVSPRTSSAAWAATTIQARLVAREIVGRWEHARHFELYDEVVPVLAELRRAGLKLGLVSNTSRDLDAFVRHFSLDVDAWISSGSHGKVKPSPLILRLRSSCWASQHTMPSWWAIRSRTTSSARRRGIRAILLDRSGRYPEHVDRIESLRELPEVLGL